MERSQEQGRGRNSLWLVCLYAVPFTVTLLTECKADENIIAISGRAGDNHPFGKRIGQISFVIYDRSTGQCRVVGVGSGHKVRVLTYEP
jgi:hypothetical protein